MGDPQVVQFYLSISIAIIMLGMGLSLSISDFKRIKDDPKGVFIGLFNQLILLPIIGFVIIKMVGLENELAIGLMIIAACPGGATSNLISNLAKGDLGLSVTLTALSSTITLFTIPLIANFAITHFMETDATITLGFWETFSKMVMITLVPVSIGMFIRSRSVKFADRMENPVKIASVVLMTTIIVGAVYANRNDLLPALPKVGLAVISLNVITMLIGFFMGIWFNLNLRQRVSISIECGIQNGSLALFIGQLGAMAAYPQILLAPAIYGTLMFATGGIFAAYYARLVSKDNAKNQF
ncbi:MAG: bile acid:sodium symporter [Flavobacteriales bacterium]|nr:MAG: bile acid:sodium symporter [Flavobacteriales bacterium]